jgi:hypothetical protein
MDGSRFDAWTRRRFGGAVVGALAMVAGLSAKPVVADGDLRRKRKKRHARKRFDHRACEPHRTSCNPENERRLCCAPLACGEVPELGGHHCCARRFQSCTLDSDCCNNTVCRDGACDIAL